MNNNNSMIFYQDDGQQSKERIDQVLVLQNAYNPYQIHGIEQQQMNIYSGYEQNQQIFKDNSLFQLNQNNLLHQYYLQGSAQAGNIVSNELEQNQPSQCNLYSANFCQAFEEEQYSIQQLRKSEKEIYNTYLDKKLSSKCYYQDQQLIKKRKLETNEEQFQLVQNKTQRELLEEKAVYNGNKINSGEVSYNSYIDGIGIHNQRASISQYCQARFIDEKNQFRKKQGQGNITDLIRMNEYNNQNSWGFQRLDEDKKYDWVIEDIFIQNSWSANMGSGKSQMLGKGAFGNVIKVKDNNTQIQYALKFIKKIFFSKAITETEIMKQLSDDKNIIKYYDIYLYDQQMERNQVIEIQQYLVIVMELAQASLEDILKQRIICQAHWTSVELLTVMKQISLALQSLAKKNIVHRDLKPSNILYCLKSQSYKLADFGEAKVVQEISFDQLHSPRGTKRYMSPELLNGLINIKQSNQRANQLLNDSQHKLSYQKINENKKNKSINLPADNIIEQYQENQNDSVNSENNQLKQKFENSNKDNKIIESNDSHMQKEEEEKNLEANQAYSSQKNKSNSGGMKQLNVRTNETREVMYEPYSNDIYSLGLCFYQMKYLDDLQEYHGHKSKTSTTEDYLQSKLQEDDEIDKLISKMINYNPKNRPNIHQVLNFIEEQLSKICQEQEGMTFNYEQSSSSNTIDQNKVAKSINETQLIDTFAQQNRNIPQSQSELFQEEKLRQPSSRQILFNLNNTYENILNNKIVVGSSKLSNQNNNSSKLHSFSDYEEDESIDDEDEQNEDYDNEDDDEEQQQKQIEEYQKINSNQENNIQVGIIVKADKQTSTQQKEQKNIKQQKKSTKQNKKENITQNLFEECKVNEPTENHKNDFIENKVNELQFLKLIETKNQSNLSITQKIQYMIARAQAYESLLKFQKARDTYQELYEKHFQCLSPFDQINLLKNLGRLDHKMSKFNSSIKFYQQLLELLKQSKELNDLQISEVYQMLGSAHCFQGDYQAALLYYDESLKKKEMQKDSIEKEEIADLLVYIGLVKKHLQQYQSSLENYQKALEIVNENPEKNLKRISCIKKNMGTVYDHLQNNSQSVQYLESALQDTIQAYGTENERVVNCLNKLGIVLVHSGMHNHEQAIRHFERAIKIMKKLYKMDTINESLRKQFRFKDNPLDEAISPLYTRALEVNEEAYILYRQVYDYYHVGVGIILEIRGMIYHYLQKFSFAVKYYTEALNIYTIILKPEHEFVKRSQAFVNMAKTEKKFQNFPKI
ncbi:hypothetical protein ABPG74_003311 [Tetrahymena malaccensis]